MRTVRKVLIPLCPFAALVATLIWPPVAFAQRAEAPPQPSLSSVPPVWLGYLIMFVLLAVVLAVSLMPSKRGHQD
jgi:hypothetical protein